MCVLQYIGTQPPPHPTHAYIIYIGRKFFLVELYRYPYTRANERLCPIVSVVSLYIYIKCTYTSKTLSKLTWGYTQTWGYVK